MFATDGGGLESGPVTVRVNITESNDHPPEISAPLNVAIELYENEVPSRPIHRVEAVDADGNDLSFIVTAGDSDMISFGAVGDGSTVDIWLVEGFDFEMVQQYLFAIAVNDGFYTSEPVTITINILPVNEHGPVFFYTQLEVDIFENTPPYSFQMPIFATDLDMDSENTTHGVVTMYYLSPPSPYFAVTSEGANSTETILTNLLS